MVHASPVLVRRLSPYRPNGSAGSLARDARDLCAGVGPDSSRIALDRGYRTISAQCRASGSGTLRAVLASDAPRRPDDRAPLGVLANPARDQVLWLMATLVTARIAVLGMGTRISSIPSV